MAAAPVKSPLHNFPLTFLKWGSKKDQRCRRPPYDTPLSPSPPPLSDAEPSNSKGSRSSRNRRNNNHRYPPTPPPPSSLPTTTAPDGEEEEDEEEKDCGKKPEVAEEGEGEGEDEGDGGEKGWNLRPRRAAAMKGISSTTTTNTHTPTMVEAAGDHLPKSMRLRGSETQGNGGTYGGRGSEMREYKRFWIALSRDEIEEDIYSMTSSKPSRRPKKRPKNVQKQLDNVFPGLWMVGFSPKSYRSIDELPKR